MADRTGQTGKGTLAQRLRLWSGLVLMGYVTFHYINHALGHISLGAMEAMLDAQEIVTGSIAGLIVLYGSLLVHVVLALGKLVNIRTWRRPRWEWAQIALGLAIPWFLFSHLTYTRGAESLLGLEMDYERELALLWPGAWIQQSLLLLIVWVHGCVGIHFWLRLRRSYLAWAPWLAGLAVLVPALSLTGWIVAARREVDRVQQLASEADPDGKIAGDATAMLQQLGRLEDVAQWFAIAVAAIVVAIMAIRWFAMRFRASARVTYGDGVVVNSAPGHTLLEVSRAAGIAHMSVCGGRARCSTCRTLIVNGSENLSTQTDAEAHLLGKLNAGPDVRLACQARVRGDVAIRPLIQPHASVHAPRSADPLGWGVEREIAVLFLDIRGFSKISEKSLPYDVVFILNSLFGEVGSGIEAANGYIDKFMGDGLMALFGLDSTPQEASRDAIRAAIAAQRATQSASRMLTQHLNEPLRIGIGIDTGMAVIGRIGRTADQTSPSRLTAIGDTVNIAARLESATKELNCGIVISARTLARAGIEAGATAGERTTIAVHNISQRVDVLAVNDLDALSAALDSSAPKMPGKPGRRGTLFDFAGGLATRTKKTGSA
jgi:adenylate cyclase